MPRNRDHNLGVGYEIYRTGAGLIVVVQEAIRNKKKWAFAFLIKTLKQYLQLRRLSSRYLGLAAVFSVVVFILGGIATWYAIDTKRTSSARLELMGKVEILSKGIQNKISAAELRLHDIFISGDDKKEVSPVPLLEEARVLSEKLSQINIPNRDYMVEVVSRLRDELSSYISLVGDLLEKRKDLNWLYPALPFINGSMLDANESFETAIVTVLSDYKQSLTDDYRQEVFRRFYEANDLWRRIILNFRAMLIRFSGLQNVPLGASAEEQNVYLLYSELKNVLRSLSDMKEKGLLSFQGEESVTQMLESSKDWMAGFEQIRNMRLSVYWRADVEYLVNRIRPVQNSVLAKLERLEEMAEAYSRDDSNVIENTITNLLTQAWIFTLLTILFVFMGYRMLHKSILRPVADVSQALWAESKGNIPLQVTAGGTEEIDHLVEAFTAMRKQVNERQQALEHQALHDALTGMPNRVLLNDRLDHMIGMAQRDREPITLMLLDLNGFKEINDTLGHQVGDLVLQKVGERIKSVIRVSDTLARLGGDEFAIALGNTDEAGATEIANKLTTALLQHIEVAGHKLQVGASTGIAMFPQHGNTARILIQRADIAMYLAKRSRRPFMFYNREQDTHNIGTLTLPADLDAALENDSLQLFYQPKLELSDRTVWGAEALLRWQHPRRGWINPEDVVELAESTAQIHALTTWVLDKALRDCKQWHERGMMLNIAVNLSPQNLHDPDFVTVVRSKLEKYSFPGKNLTLELTENAFINDPAQAMHVIRSLRELEVGVAIDDFGTGFSSLSYLKQLAVNELKIDKVFVMNMPKNDDDTIIVRSTIYMAQNLGLKVVAEGVENADSLVVLDQLGCDLVQGYHLGRPMPMSEFLTWLADWRGISDLPPVRGSRHSAI